ncbi:sulfate adenylyltransferase [Klebsiella pneumoniae]|uniref:Sulfate adenylyltransferase n=1 Tax=Klebsiella pneumoniae TaxID=573 RepID=A0A377U1K6_KLEPN|nr:sulfate adenylyltransferase [Klebsiella pneumoniae]
MKTSSLRCTTTASVTATQGEKLDLALLVDGLQAEREQGITIDVAYRYFSTEKRNLSSPTPRGTSSTRAIWPLGRPPATWRSCLIDARKGVLDQDPPSQLHLDAAGH